MSGGGTVRVLWDSDDSAVVNIYGPTGSVASGFKVGGNAVTFPYTLTSSTSFVTTLDDRYSVSVKISGVEIADTPDGPRTANLYQGAELVFAPSPDDRGAAAVANLEAVRSVIAGDVADPATTIGASLNSAYVGQNQWKRLRAFKAGMAAAKAGTGTCDILTIGDSIAEGTGSSSIEKRWASRFRDGLRTRAGLTGGRGYVPATYAVPGATQPWVLSGGAVDFTLNRGLGIRASRLNVTGATATLSVPAGHTDVDLLITCDTSTTSWFNYTVDGVTGTSPASPVNVQARASSTLRDVVVNVATGLNPAVPHTIVVTWNVGNVYLSGAMLYNGDKTTGIRLWDGARHGKNSSWFADPTMPWNYTMNTIQPDLVIIELGRNDWSSGIASATVKTNISTIIGSVRAQVTNDPSIILMAVYGNLGTGPVEPWQNYVDAMKAIAASDSQGDISVIDLYSRMGTVTNAASNGLGMLGSDFVHPTDLGEQVISEALLDFVTYPIPA